MTIAFNVHFVRVAVVLGSDGSAMLPGSLWRTGKLVFKAAQAGHQLLCQPETLALAKDCQGREYIIWRADHPRQRGLVIQRLDSHYCYGATLEALSAGEGTR